MAKLTKRAIDSFRYRGGWDVRWDDDIPGFGVRIYPSGKKAFVLSYRADGRKRLMVLGRYGADLTLDQARTRARRHLVQVRDGLDPLEERSKKAAGQTFKVLIEAYIERHAKVHKKTWKDDLQRLNRHVPAGWLHRKASSITREEIAELHDRIGRETPYEANRFLEVLRMAFNLARFWRFVDETAPNPAQGITRYRERKRARWVKPQEIPALARAIDAQPNLYVRAALWLYLLTGVRKTELLCAKWDDVDFDQQVLTLPETKSGETQFAALSAPAVAILRSIPRLPDNPHLLPGLKPGAHLTNIDRYWRVIRKEAGIEDVRLHDLRRTVGSWLSQAGVELNTIKNALRHANISTTLTYARLGADPAREAMEAHGRRVMEIVGRPRLVEGGGAKE